MTTGLELQILERLRELADGQSEISNGLTGLKSDFSAHIRAHEDYDKRKTDSRSNRRWLFGYVLTAITAILTAIKLWRR